MNSRVTGAHRKKLVVSQSRREGVYNRAGDVNVTFCGKEEQRHEHALTFEKSRSKRYKACSDVAEAVGFEPTVPLRVHLISSQGRYNHFDTCPYSVRFLSRAVIMTQKLRRCKPFLFAAPANAPKCPWAPKNPLDSGNMACYYLLADNVCGPSGRLAAADAGVAQWPGHQPSKLGMRVRFPSPAPSYAPVAQLDRATAF